MRNNSSDRRDDLSLCSDEEPVLRVMFVAAEAFPMAKTGGLADVCSALPQVLAQFGADIRLLIPGYREALERVVAPHVVLDLGEVLPGANARLVQGWIPDSALPVWLIDCPSLYHRPGTLYQDAEGHDWPDNALRFGLLNHVAARIALGRVALGWRPDIVHAHDWHAGLTPLLIRMHDGEVRPRTVFTVHNMAFQGNFPLESASRLGLPDKLLNADGIEFFGQLSFLKAGIRYADRVTTVSPTYAREILTPQFGFGMDGVLKARGDEIVGILNGIDADIWNPQTDAYLQQHYSRDAPRGKRLCKAELQRKLGLGVDSAAPLAVFVSRLTYQKMADVVLDELPDILGRHPRLQFAIHGRGDHALEHGFSHMAARFPQRVAALPGYDEAQTHQLHAGGDILVHGSRFEPCGLTQMYAMRYGTIPVVSRVGGLADSVVDVGVNDEQRADATGFVFDEATRISLADGLARSVAMYETQPETWSQLRRQAMASDFTWSRSAADYVRIYKQLVPDRVLLPGDPPATRNTAGQRKTSHPRRRRGLPHNDNQAESARQSG